MKVLSKAILTYKEELYKQSAAELAIGGCLLVVDDLLPYLFRACAKQVLDLPDEEITELSHKVQFTEEIKHNIFAGFEDIMNGYAEMDGKNAIDLMRKELAERGISAEVGFKGGR